MDLQRKVNFRLEKRQRSDLKSLSFMLKESFSLVQLIFSRQIRRFCADPNLKVVILKMRNARHLDATSCGL